MSELKTLKDLIYKISCRATGQFTLRSQLPTFVFNGDEQHELVTNEFCKLSELKAETIKWLRHRVSRCRECTDEADGLILFCEEHIFWMERYNVTEEDLK